MTTHILRPNADADATELALAGAPTNWQCVDEAVANDWTDTVKNVVAAAAWRYDLYDSVDPVFVGIITSVTIWVRCSCPSGDGGGSCRTVIKTLGTEYRGDTHALPADNTFYNFSTVYNNHPAGGAWSLAQVGALQIGVDLLNQLVKEYGDPACTQVWAVITYKVTQATGGGAIAITGTLVRLPKLAVGAGSIAIAGALGRGIARDIGEGAVASSGGLVARFVNFQKPAIVKINDVKVILLRDSLYIDRRIEARSIAGFTVIDKAGTSHYTKGEPVLIYDNVNVLAFSGVIDTPEEEEDGNGLLHHITCADNHYLADKRLAAASYIDTLAGGIVESLRATYLAGEGVTVGVIQDGPILKQVVLNYVRVSEAFDALAEKANFIWNIDELKKLNFIDRATNAAPWAATRDEIIRGSARLSGGSPLYRNRQYIRGGKGETDPQTETFTGNGDTKAFTVGYPIALIPSGTTGSVSVTSRDPVLQTVGVKGIDVAKDCYWNKGDATIAFDIAPENAETVTIVYTGEFNIITLSEDDDGILNRRTIEGGGTGYVDDIARDPNITTLAASFEAAAKKLQRYGVLGRRFIYQTHDARLVPGMLQSITYSPFNLSTNPMLIEAVRMQGQGKLFTNTITAIEGPEVGGWAKFFQQIVEREKLIDRLTVGGGETETTLVQKSEERGWQEAVNVIVMDVEILRPNAAGDETDIAHQYPDSDSHWDKVDEAITDENGTYVYEGLLGYRRDLYNLPAHAGTGVIYSVTVYIRCRSVGGYSKAKPSIKSGGVVSDGDIIEPTIPFATYHYQWLKNPADDEDWEWADIDSLQIGMSLLETLCTQVWVEVEHIA